jgi:hypothetical protein
MLEGRENKHVPPMSVERSRVKVASDNLLVGFRQAPDRKSTNLGVFDKRRHLFLLRDLSKSLGLSFGCLEREVVLVVLAG